MSASVTLSLRGTCCITAGGQHWLQTVICHLLQHARTQLSCPRVWCFLVFDITDKTSVNMNPYTAAHHQHTVSSRATLLGIIKGITWHFGGAATHRCFLVVFMVKKMLQLESVAGQVKVVLGNKTGSVGLPLQCMFVFNQWDSERWMFTWTCGKKQ